MEKVLFENSISSLKEFLGSSNYSSYHILVDENTEKHCLPLIKEIFPEDSSIIEIKSGEENKNITTLSLIWESLTNSKTDREGLLINLGGGVIGDMGGFAAATYKRGIDFVNIPTTLLSMVDASVGGKLGVDFQGFKNHIGIFQEPLHVFIDTTFLNTLPKRQLLSGFAEIIKHGLIANRLQWDALKNSDPNMLNWKEIVPKSVSIKERVVKSDFKESGLRKTLNFGHTVGHAIESYLLETDNQLFHGEAIAAGMILESYLSMQYLNLSETDFLQIKEFLLNNYPKAVINKSDFSPIIELMRQDKKNKDGVIKMALISQPGKAQWDIEVSESSITECLNQYLEY